jgi:hypothetical protein
MPASSGWLCWRLGLWDRHVARTHPLSWVGLSGYAEPELYLCVSGFAEAPAEWREREASLKVKRALAPGNCSSLAGSKPAHSSGKMSGGTHCKPMGNGREHEDKLSLLPRLENPGSGLPRDSGGRPGSPLTRSWTLERGEGASQGAEEQRCVLDTATSDSTGTKDFIPQGSCQGCPFFTSLP